MHRKNSRPFPNNLNDKSYIKEIIPKDIIGENILAKNKLWTEFDSGNNMIEVITKIVRKIIMLLILSVDRTFNCSYIFLKT